MKVRSLVIATHGHCFDGLASAALFTRLVQAVEPAPLEPRYLSCGYGPDLRSIPEAWLSGDLNAILDFRYTPSSKVSWYFDHHVTGFGSAEEREEAVAREGVFHDPSYGSCAKLIADVARTRFGLELDAEGLVRWAHIIDSASFEDAAQATDPTNPVLQLAAVVEHHGDRPLLEKLVPWLLESSLEEVAARDEVSQLYAPIAASRAAFVERVRDAGVVKGRTVFVDLSAAPVDVAAKFVTYALYPEAMYSVMLTRTKHLKLSVGYNPWCGRPRDRDIAALCRRFGGGGHPVVGAASFPLNQLEQAQAAAAEMLRQLEG